MLTEHLLDSIAHGVFEYGPPRRALEANAKTIRWLRLFPGYDATEDKLERPDGTFYLTVLDSLRDGQIHFFCLPADE